MNLDKLLDKAKWLKLNENELKAVVQRIENHKNESVSNLYTLLHILGKTEAKQYRPLVEKFLVFPEEPMISRIALMILCNYWDYTTDYLSHLVFFLKRADWDEEQDVMLLAITIVGEFLCENYWDYYRKKIYFEILIQLMNIFSNKENSAVIRAEAYVSILYVTRTGQGDPPAFDELVENFEKYIDQEAINKAEQIIKENDVQIF